MEWSRRQRTFGGDPEQDRFELERSPAITLSSSQIKIHDDLRRAIETSSSISKFMLLDQFRSEAAVQTAVLKNRWQAETGTSESLKLGRSYSPALTA